jgi:FkbM family methyltransferase
MKKLLHYLIGRAGYTLLNTEYMPSGIALDRDIRHTIAPETFKTVFDVGANKGDMALYFSTAFPNAKIHAFEPISSTFQLLVNACKQVPNIQPVQLGFAEEPGLVKVYLQSDHGLNSINSNVNKPDEKNLGKFEEIRLDTLDAYCKREGISSIDLLKTDAEGLDLSIIKGAEELIKAGKVSYIMAEVGFSEDNLRNTFFEALRSYLYNYGYKVRGFYDQSNFGNKPYMTCANALFALQTK